MANEAAQTYNHDEQGSLFSRFKRLLVEMDKDICMYRLQLQNPASNAALRPTEALPPWAAHAQLQQSDSQIWTLRNPLGHPLTTYNHTDAAWVEAVLDSVEEGGLVWLFAH
ncbi:hypothetical protein E4U41_002974 [Claviceps citrina]|nr:hypothetical protein E4U41_002974 [Claviceps citrina]